MGLDFAVEGHTETRCWDAPAGCAEQPHWLKEAGSFAFTMTKSIPAKTSLLASAAQVKNQWGGPILQGSYLETSLRSRAGYTA